MVSLLYMWRARHTCELLHQPALLLLKTGFWLPCWNPQREAYANRVRKVWEASMKLIFSMEGELLIRAISQQRSVNAGADTGLWHVIEAAAHYTVG